MANVTGKDIEANFNIPQQYRSRYDKQFANFISHSTETPRTYNDYDIIAYELITKMRGQSRLVIARKLAEMAKADIIKFYPSTVAKSPDDILNYNPLAKVAPPESGTAPARRERPTKKKNGISGYSAADEIGKLKERNVILDEQLGDAWSEIDILKKQLALNASIVDQLTMRMFQLEKKLNRLEDCK